AAGTVTGTSGAQTVTTGSTGTSVGTGGASSTVTGTDGTAVGTTTGTTGGGGDSSVTSDTTATSTTGAPAEPEPTLVTSGQGNYWVVGEVTEATGAANVTVNEGQTFQDWIGWGGTFNEAGWDALKAVSAEDRDHAIRLLFDKVDG